MTAVVRGWRADDYADRQRQLAPTKQADGQCRACATFRLDGEPPTVHRHGCVEGPDGMQVGVLWTTAPAAVVSVRRGKRK